tara:strand:- start:70 stop:531 length:462 start_codon:yes stop_codon:yes gene_type:complete
MYILRPDIPEEEVDTHLKKYSEMIIEAGAEVLDSQMRGKRRLAYPIAKHKEGIYVQLSHNGNGQHVAVIEKAMRLSEDVIRYLTVKQDGPLPTPRVVNNTEQKSSGDEEDKKTESETKKNNEAESKEEPKIKVNNDNENTKKDDENTKKDDEK